MNIFDIYLDKIIKIVTDQNKIGSLKLPKTLDSINVDIPPNKFDCDISTNVAMVLAKINETQRSKAKLCFIKFCLEVL